MAKPNVDIPQVVQAEVIVLNSEKDMYHVVELRIPTPFYSSATNNIIYTNICR